MGVLSGFTIALTIRSLDRSLEDPYRPRYSLG